MEWIPLLLLTMLLAASARAFLPLAEDSADCDLECGEFDSSTPVCGNDGRTYDSRCDIEIARCQGHPVRFKHNGKCVERARCQAQRRLIREQGEKPGQFVPECRADGGYAPVQCHRSTGYCWCVDEAGKPQRGSSVHNARPNCAAPKGRRNNRRRSSRGRKNRKGCSTNDRASFNANLIDIFQSEYNRVEHSTGTASPGSDPLRDTHEKQVVQWKFDELDDNGDAYLKRKEIRDLRRMAKKIVKPKSCAKAFAKFCDLDQDKKISRSEWSVCVGVDINNEQVNGVDDFLDDAPKAAEEQEKEEPTEKPWDGGKHVHQLRHDGTQPSPEKDAEEASREEAEPQDCPSARRAALDSRRQNPSAGVYAPECTADGLYARAQCHKSPELCWCAHPRTGRPLKGTTTRGAPPDCDAAARMRLKNFKGCSMHKKQEFLDELVQSFIREMQDDARNKSIVIDNPTPEKGARWKFASIDINSNNVLDKREWKAFKGEWRSFRQRDGRQRKRLRKCWRNLPRFCDENDNQKITVDEWLACTSVTRDSKSSLPRNQNRRGKNPFSTILKSD